MPFRDAGGGFFVSGSPAHLVMLTELAMADEKRQGRDRK
jgi:hypothetical protein